MGKGYGCEQIWIFQFRYIKIEHMPLSLTKYLN